MVQEPPATCGNLCESKVPDGAQARRVGISGGGAQPPVGTNGDLGDSGHAQMGGSLIWESVLNSDWTLGSPGEL